MILKVGFLVGASLAAFAVTQISTNSARKRKSSTDVSENCDSRSQERNVKDEDEKEAMVRMEDRKGYEAFELELLSNVVMEMEQRRMSQETELIELFGLKQQQLSLTHLQKQLKAKIIMIDMLNATKIALQAERIKLHEDINENLIAKKELEIAKERIKEIQATINEDDEEMKGQLRVLKEQLLGFNKKGTSVRDESAEKKLLAMEDIKSEVAAMKRKNRELKVEARELTVKLVTAEARVAALSNVTKEKVLANVEEEISSLKQSSEDLSGRVERLQKNKFDMVEELVYQRWLNACLRFEIQDHQTPRETKPKHDHLKKKLSFDSQVRAKRVSLDSTSSRTSSLESDDTSCTTSPTYSSDQKSIPKKFNLIRSVKRWGKGKTVSGNVEYSASQGITRRFSMSDVPSNPSILRKKVKEDLTDQSPGTPTPRRVRRVSFSDSVKPEIPTFQDAPKSCHADCLEAFEDVSDASCIELDGDKLETSASATNAVEANGSGKLISREDMEKDEEEESQMVKNAVEIGQTRELNPAVMAMGVDDQNVHPLSLVLLILFILLIFFIVFMLVF